MVRASCWKTVEGGAAAAGAGGHHGHELPEAHHLQKLLGDDDLASAVAAGFRGQGDAYGVADASLQHDAHGGGGGDNALRAHAGFGQAQMQRVVGAAGEFGIDRDQVLYLAHLGRQDDAVAGKPGLLGKGRRMQS